jgi:hypothetical protein
MPGISTSKTSIPFSRGGSQSWEDTLYGQSDLNLWVKTDTRDGVALPNSLGGDPVTILPMVASLVPSTNMLNTGVTVSANTIWVIRCRAGSVTSGKTQGALVTGQSTRFIFGCDVAGKWRFGWGDTTGLNSTAGAQDTNWHTIIMYDKRMWVKDPDISVTDINILNIIATDTPTVNHSEATWSGTAGEIHLGGWAGAPFGIAFDYALSYEGTITDNIITWGKKIVLHGSDAYDILVSDAVIAWITPLNTLATYSQYGSQHMMDLGYTLLRNISGVRKWLPNLENGDINILTTLPTGYYITEYIDGDENNYNYAPAMLNIPYANFNKDDTDIWEDTLRADTYYDASYPFRWDGTEIDHWNFINKSKTAYKSIVFAKRNRDAIFELYSYNTNVDSVNVAKILQYIGIGYYNYDIVFGGEIETDDLLYKYTIKRQLFYQKDSVAFTFNPDGYIYYSEDSGETFPYIAEFADATNIQMCFIFANGTILFATRTKMYYSTNKLATITEYIVEDTDGSDYLPHTPVDPAYPGTYFSIVQNYQSFTLPNGKEIFIWGNYANSILKNGASPANVYYSVDGGRPKIAYKYGVNPNYKDDGTNDGGSTGNELGDSTNPLYCRHIHSVAYNNDLDEFYVCSGDATNECHWIKGIYNILTDSWTWSNIIINQSPATRWKAGSFWYHTDGYIYFSADSTSLPFDYGFYKVLPENIGDNENTITLKVFTGTSASFWINGAELIGRSAVEGNFMFYSNNLADIYTIVLSKSIGYGYVIGMSNNKNTDDYCKFNVSDTNTELNYANDIALLIKMK